MKKPKIPVIPAVTVVAASTALLSLLNANLPVWGIFLGWAVASCFRAQNQQPAMVLPVSLTAGSLFGAASLQLQQWFLRFFSQEGSVTPVLTVAATMAAILIVNPALLLLARQRYFSFVPGMFVGFSTAIGAYLGKFGPAPHDLYQTCLVTSLMGLLGVVCASTADHLTSPRQQSLPTRTMSSILGDDGRGTDPEI